MEIIIIKKELNKYIYLIILVLTISLLAGCQSQGDVKRELVHASRYPIFSICPDFNIHAKGDTLYKRHLFFQDGREFPLTGTLYIDGVAYRFMGSDSLRLFPIAPLSTPKQGWQCKYVFLSPAEDWIQPDYDDTHWYSGEGAFASSDVAEKHTVWNSAHVYIRRTFSIDKEVIGKRNIHIYHSHDDSFSLYLNGHLILTRSDFMIDAHVPLPEEAYSYLKEGENLLAVHCNNKAWGGVLDVGLYAEDDSERGKVTATQLSVDVQATQTHYKFQCGQIELNLSFLSPLLIGKSVLGHPLSYMFYSINSLDNDSHHVRLDFKLDTQSIFGESTTQMVDSTDWKIVCISSEANSLFRKEQNLPLWGHLFIGMRDEKVVWNRGSNGYFSFSYGEDNTQCSSGVLTLGYDEQYALQYLGDNLRPYWNRKGKNIISDMMKSGENTVWKLKSFCDESDKYFRDKAIDQGGIDAMAYYFPYYRTIVASHHLAETEDGMLICTGDPIGCIVSERKYISNLVFFERADLMKGMLNPIFDFCESGRWNSCYPPYDLGPYPFALHQVDRSHRPVENACAIMAMASAITYADANSKYSLQHEKLLRQWSKFIYSTSSLEDFPFLYYWSAPYSNN